MGGGKSGGQVAANETLPSLPAFREPANLFRSPRLRTEFTQSFQSLARLISEALPDPPATLKLGIPPREEKGIGSSQPRQGPNRYMPARKAGMTSHPRKRLARSDNSAQLGSFRNFARAPDWLRSVTLAGHDLKELDRAFPPPTRDVCSKCFEGQRRPAHFGQGGSCCADAFR